MEAKFATRGVILALLLSGCSSDRVIPNRLSLDTPSHGDELVTGSSPAIAAMSAPKSEASLGPGPAEKVVAVADDGGGRILDYAIKTATLRDRRSLVHFTGRCASACTIYLSLPPEQLCISPSARFQFHQPIATTGRARAHAETYLLNVYPEWVRDWIAAQGGLGKNFITMDYDYTQAFLQTCEPSTRMADAAKLRGKPPRHSGG